MAAAFSCRICREKFNLSKLLNDTIAATEGYSVVSTQCGHLFHEKCLGGALTNQKLLHARHGTGPLRRFCPVPRCNSNIPSEESIVTISFDENENEDKEDSEDISEDIEGKLMKRISVMSAEKGKFLESMEKANNEIEALYSVLEEIKLDLSDIQSFLKDDSMMRKGDLIFWVTKEGTYAPGKVLEIRKKTGENIHYAVVKLEKKANTFGVGPYSVNRDTLVLPVTDLTTFKSFFKEYFDKFQSKFESIMIDLNSEIQLIASSSSSSPGLVQSPSSDKSLNYHRSTRRASRISPSPSTVSASQNALAELDSISVESIPTSHFRNESQADRNGIKLGRSQTIHGIRNEPRRIEKCRSLSWATPATNTMNSPTLSEGKRTPQNVYEHQELILEHTREDEDQVAEFIQDGERVIWYDTYSEYQQTGTVASVCEFSPCAIVKFDEHPIVKHKFQFRTVPLDELFPYDLASPEEKIRLAEMYGTMEDFISQHENIFNVSNEEASSDFDGECDA